MKQLSNVCRMIHVLFTLFVFVCALWCSTNIVSCYVLLFFVLSTLCCQFLWIVHLWLPLRYSLTFMSKLFVSKISFTEWAHKTNLTPQIFIQEPVLSREIKRSCICVLMVSNLPLSSISYENLEIFRKFCIFLRFSFYLCCITCINTLTVDNVSVWEV